MKLRIDVTINDDVAGLHFSDKESAREYVAREVRYCIGHLYNCPEKFIERLAITDQLQGSKEA